MNDSTAKGPGVIDMKGGDVIILHALRALKDAGQLDRMNVVVVITGDEEDSGTPRDIARAALVAEAQGAVAALGFEDGAGDPRTAVISRRGAGSLDRRRPPARRRTHHRSLNQRSAPARSTRRRGS